MTLLSDPAAEKRDAYRDRLTALIQGYGDAMFHLGDARTPETAGAALRDKTERYEALLDYLKILKQTP